MIEGFDHVGTDHKCSVCQCDFTDDEGGVQGYLGILPVAFCPFCFSGLCSMVWQLDAHEWEGLTDDEIDQGLVRTNYAMQTAGAWRDGVEWAEAKLKEKNYEGED